MSLTEHTAGSGHVAHTARGEAQRDALIDAAYHLIAEGGFERLRTREVAARAGVNIATLHYYFATKEDLIRGVAERLFREVSSTIGPQPRAPGGHPLEEWRQEYLDNLYLLEESRATFIVLLEMYQRALRDPFLHEIINNLEVPWRQHYTGILTAGVEQGIFRADLDIPATATALTSLVRGDLLMRLIQPHPFPAERLYAQVEQWLLPPPSPDAAPSQRRRSTPPDE